MFSKYDISIILLVIFLKFILINFIGIVFEYEWIYQMWHFIDIEYLKNDLLSSLYYFHYQPPVFNLFLGLVLKQGIFSPEKLLFFIFHGMTILMFIGMHFYYRSITNSKIVYLLLPALFLFSPQTIIYENWPIYTWSSSFIILMGYFCLNRIHENIKVYTFLFFLLISLLILSRSAFHPIYYIFFVSYFLFRYRKELRKIALSIIIPTLLILVVMLKNKAEFGFYGVGSGLGFSLFKIVSKKKLDIKIEESEGKLDEIMKITPVKSISTYYDSDEIMYTEKHKKIPLLVNEFKSSRDTYGDEYSVNLGNIHYLKLAKRYQEGAFYLIKKYPLEYLERVSKALIMFFKPSWDHGFGVETNKTKLKNYIDFFYLENLRLKIENAFYEVRKPWPLRKEIALSSYLLMPFFYLICILLFINRLKSCSFNLFKVQDKYIFSIVTVIYLVTVSSLVELAENDRYRVMIDPMVFVAVVSLVLLNFERKLKVK
tara:strand:- start:1170 stop:2624 length:1455 start_codon:yes stop_codon:yes gene_type:complete